VGTDRIIEFEFSDGQYRLFLEFYAAGNVILTGKDLDILALQRIVSEGEGQEELRVGLKYSLENRQNYGGIPTLTTERLKSALQKAVDRGEGSAAGGKKGKKNAKDGLRKALAVSITEFPPMLVDHSMKVLNFDSELKPADILENPDTLAHLMRCLQKAQNVIQEITSLEVAKGYIIAKRKEGASEEDTSRKVLVYDDFHPFRPRQFEDDPTCIFLEHGGFNKTVDEFFSSIEGQKLESKLEERELAAKRKLEAARQDQAKRLGGLVEVQELHMRKAGALEVNAERVQEAMDSVNGLIAQGMDWMEIGKLIEWEQKRGNPVAEIIKLPLKLQENTITLLLDEEEAPNDDESAYETASDVSDSEEEAPMPAKKEKKVEKRLTIDIDLSLTPWANSRDYYNQKKTAKIKEEKTLESSAQALKSQETKIAQQLKKGLKTEKAILRPVRKQMWFEKFTWFISSDGYLVLGGRDAQQNEILYKKYLKKGDIYLSADLEGAATVVIKNNPRTPDAQIPPSTLSQAGTLGVATSSAWDSKAGMSAWWVNTDQVSKQTSTGDFLPTGSFVIRGKKNFLPPAQLVLGFGVMFLISEESKARHFKHRVGEIRSINAPAIDNAVDRQEPSSIVDDAGSANGDVTDSDVEEEQEQRENLLQTGSRPEADDEPQNKAQVAENDDDDDNNEDDNDDDNPATSLGDLNFEETKDPEEYDRDSADDIVSTMPVTTKATKTAPPPPQRKRGQKAKAKKIATKYKDQDEEDRLMAQELLGSVAGVQKAESEAKLKAAREAEAVFQKERRRAQHQRTQKETADHEAARKAMLEEDAGMDEEEEDRLTSIDALVGTALPGDEILEAIPMCAPFSAMNKCKYKIKLQPGTVKKGKAVKEILGRWTSDANLKWVDKYSQDAEKIWPRELELLKGWKVEEVTNTVVVSRVKIMMSGGAAAAGKGKSGGARGGKGSKKR